MCSKGQCPTLVQNLRLKTINIYVGFIVDIGGSQDGNNGCIRASKQQQHFMYRETLVPYLRGEQPTQHTGQC